MNNPKPLAFRLLAVDRQSAARRSVLQTPHGSVDLPAFMPVGTQGSVKGLLPDVLRECGTQILLANTYHLMLRPGAELIAELGGLHRFMAWDGAILTDSGGFQLYSLAARVEITEQQVTFQSHIDGARVDLSPEKAIELQQQFGSDIAMVLDDVVGLPNTAERIELACRRTVRWAQRSLAAHRRRDQALFAIVQGGLDVGLRLWCAQELAAMPFDGFALGGLSVGEPAAQMYRIVEETCPALPADRPRYLMGVGRPQDILQAVAAGVDLFDCVLPTRNGRNAMAFTDAGPIRIRNAQYRNDPRPLDPDTPSLASRFSRAYLRHLFLSGEMLGPLLISAHNVAYYQRLMAEIRMAIEQGCFLEYAEQKRARWQHAQAEFSD